MIVQYQVFLVGGWLIGLFRGQEIWLIVLVLTYFVALDKFFTLLSDSEGSSSSKGISNTICIHELGFLGVLKEVMWRKRI